MADLNVTQADIDTLSAKLQTLRDDLTPEQNKLLDAVLGAGSGAISGLIGNSAATIMVQLKQQSATVDSLVARRDQL